MSKINPKHYQTNNMEAIEVIEAFNLDHHRACALKYILRAGKKDGEGYVEDLQKAVWYLERKLEKFVVAHTTEYEINTMAASSMEKKIVDGYAEIGMPT